MPVARPPAPEFKLFEHKNNLEKFDPEDHVHIVRKLVYLVDTNDKKI